LPTAYQFSSRFFFPLFLSPLNADFRLALVDFSDFKKLPFLLFAGSTAKYIF
jgi:hypothetical protein